MRRVRVKVCGITNKTDLGAAVDAGADALGFVVDVPASPRSISPEDARALIDATPPFVQGVVVSVFHSIDQLATLCSLLAPDAMQVAGTFPRADTISDHLRGVRLIRTVAVNGRTVPHVALRSAARCDAILVDSCVSGAYGGTGTPHDWAVSQTIRDLISPTPLILAGGLTSSNVQTAIETVRPYAVDVSSGVEVRPGIKDGAKIRAFIEAVTEATDGL
ncbi:MAG: phosphoribosylanthranilate isomerase [Halobacteriota archaeon]